METALSAWAPGVLNTLNETLSMTYTSTVCVSDGCPLPYLCCRTHLCACEFVSVCVCVRMWACKGVCVCSDVLRPGLGGFGSIRRRLKPGTGQRSSGAAEQELRLRLPSRLSED